LSRRGARLAAAQASHDQRPAAALAAAHELVARVHRHDPLTRTIKRSPCVTQPLIARGPERLQRWLAEPDRRLLLSVERSRRPAAPRLEGLAADGLAIPEPIGPGVYIEHTRGPAKIRVKPAIAPVEARGKRCAGLELLVDDEEVDRFGAVLGGGLRVGLLVRNVSPAANERRYEAEEAA
jgi:hypothetical protein